MEYNSSHFGVYCAKKGIASLQNRPGTACQIKKAFRDNMNCPGTNRTGSVLIPERMAQNCRWGGEIRTHE